MLVSHVKVFNTAMTDVEVYLLFLIEYTMIEVFPVLKRLNEEG